MKASFDLPTFVIFCHGHVGYVSCSGSIAETLFIFCHGHVGDISCSGSILKHCSYSVMVMLGISPVLEAFGNIVRVQNTPKCLILPNCQVYFYLLSCKYLLKRELFFSVREIYHTSLLQQPWAFCRDLALILPFYFRHFGP